MRIFGCERCKVVITEHDKLKRAKNENEDDGATGNALMVEIEREKQCKRN